MMRIGLQLLLVLSIFPAIVFAQGKSKLKSRIYVGPVVAMYRNDAHYTINSKARAAVNLGARFEYRLSRRAGIGPAFEYIAHGLRFQSYYFSPGQHALYDKSFPYMHLVRLQELHMPVIFKYSFKNENDYPENVNVMVGLGYRYIFQARTSIMPVNGNRITWEDKIDARLENSLFGGYAGAMLMTGMGAEKNFQITKTSFFSEIMFKYPLSRWEYTTNGEAATFYIKDSFLSLNIGYKF